MGASVIRSGQKWDGRADTRRPCLQPIQVALAPSRIAPTRTPAQPITPGDMMEWKLSCDIEWFRDWLQRWYEEEGQSLDLFPDRLLYDAAMGDRIFDARFDRRLKVRQWPWTTWVFSVTAWQRADLLVRLKPDSISPLDEPLRDGLIDALNTLAGAKSKTVSVETTSPDAAPDQAGEPPRPGRRESRAHERARERLRSGEDETTVKADWCKDYEDETGTAPKDTGSGERELWRNVKRAVKIGR